MNRLTWAALLCVLTLFLLPVSAQTSKPAKAKTDAETQEFINLSIASYSGSCPCPYNTDRGDRRCGGRRAYSRKDGAAPLCYPDDVTPAMVKEHRQKYSRK